MTRGLDVVPGHEFEKYLACGILSEGFARVHCKDCGYDRLVALIYRSFCTSCVRVDTFADFEAFIASGSSCMNSPSSFSF